MVRLWQRWSASRSKFTRTFEYQDLFHIIQINFNEIFNTLKILIDVIIAKCGRVFSFIFILQEPKTIDQRISTSSSEHQAFETQTKTSSQTKQTVQSSASLQISQQQSMSNKFILTMMNGYIQGEEKEKRNSA